MSLDADRRNALTAAKLAAVVRARWGEPKTEQERRPGPFPDGASLFEPGPEGGGHLWVLVAEGGANRLGAVLAVARRQGATEVDVLVDDPAAAGVLARRAGFFADPPGVRLLAGGEARPATPAPVPEPAVPAPTAELYRPVLADAGLDVVVEDGQLVGELNGLEVARVVVDEATGDAHVEAGVGRFDREAGSMMAAHLSETDALAKAVAVVRGERRPGAERHPLNQLVPERWLRTLVVAEPAAVGARTLAPVPSAVGRENLLEHQVATAVGEGVDGRPVVVVCSTGVDLDLVPSAADDRALHAPDARLVLVVPDADRLPITTALADDLAAPAEVVGVPGDWRADGLAGLVGGAR